LDVFGRKNEEKMNAEERKNVAVNLILGMYLGKKIRVAASDNPNGCGINGYLKFDFGANEYKIQHLTGAKTKLRFTDREISFLTDFNESENEKTIRVQLWDNFFS
jgi:RNase P/RNase MRP subunit p29